MARAFLPSPGTEFGPCDNALCGHDDCRLTRHMTDLVCRICSTAIGYERGYYSEDPGPEALGLIRRALVHSGCLEREIEREQNLERIMKLNREQG